MTEKTRVLEPRIDPISQVGAVSIVYFQPKNSSDSPVNASKQPHIKDGTIFLPDDNRFTMEVFGDGQQFLACEDNSRFNSFGGSAPVFWGGERNQKPFLYGLASSAKQAFPKGGEQTFPNHLKPKRVALFEKLARTSVTTQYGNLFMVRLGWTLPELTKLIWVFGGTNLACKDVTNQPVLGTRHRISRTYGELRSRWTPWAVAVDSVFTSDCGERASLRGVWMFQRAAHLS